MQILFAEATSFNQPLDKWDVGNVTDMMGMFHKATSFNQPLTSWDVGNVMNMRYLFNEASSFLVIVVVCRPYITFSSKLPNNLVLTCSVS